MNSHKSSMAKLVLIFLFSKDKSSVYLSNWFQNTKNFKSKMVIIYLLIDIQLYQSNIQKYTKISNSGKISPKSLRSSLPLHSILGTNKRRNINMKKAQASNKRAQSLKKLRDQTVLAESKDTS